MPQVISLDDGEFHLFNSFPRRLCIYFVEDSTRAKEAAEVMKLTAADLKELGIIEQVIPENQPLTRENMADTMEELKNRIEEFLENLSVA